VPQQLLQPQSQAVQFRWRGKRFLPGRALGQPLLEPVNGLQQPGRLDRLQDVVHRRVAERFDGELLVRGHEHQEGRLRALRPILRDGLRHLDAVRARHPDIEEGDIRA
jgi:hypothetical protein